MVRTSYILILVGAALLVTVVVLFLFKSTPLSSALLIDTVKFNDFGSFVSGSIGVIWSLAGIFLLIESLNEQRRATFENVKQIRLQQFENIFFQLVTIHHEIIKSIKITFLNTYDGDKLLDEDGNHNTKEGIHFFEEFARILNSDYFVINPTNEISNDEQLERFSEFLQENFYIYNAALGHYFSNLQSLLQYLKDFKENAKEWKDGRTKELIDNYTNILVNQLSNYEVVILAYYGLINRTHLYNLIEEFKILRELESIYQLETRMTPKWVPVIIVPQHLFSTYEHLKNEE